MLFLKRLASFLLDVVLFLAGTILIDFIFSRVELPPPPQFTIAIAFFSFFILPIFILGRPISYTILKLFIENESSTVNRLKLALKYTIYYLFVSSELFSIVLLFTEFLNYYTVIKSGLAFPIKFAALLAFLNVLCFITTFGRRNLIDALLEINYRTAGVYKRIKIGILRFTYLFSVSLIFITLIEFKLSQRLSFQTIIEEVKNFNKDYFPIEVFGNYLESNLISVRVENTNRIISPSEPSTYFLNRHLPQRQIVAFINEKTNKDQNERKKLCNLLLMYCYSNPWTYIEAYQTKVILVNLKKVNPLVNLQTIYTYYYDDKMPAYRFYGGFNPDSLSKFYENLQEDYYNTYISKLSQALGLPKDTIVKYSNEEGSIVLPEGFSIKDKDLKIPLEFKASIDGATLAVVPFEKVEPIQLLNLNFPPGNIIFSLNQLEALGSTEAEDRMFYLKTNYVLSR